LVCGYQTYRVRMLTGYFEGPSAPRDRGSRSAAQSAPTI